MRNTQNLKKSALCNGFDKSADLLSKRQNHKEDFFQIMWASQKVRTLTQIVITMIKSWFIKEKIDAMIWEMNEKSIVVSKDETLLGYKCNL